MINPKEKNTSGRLPKEVVDKVTELRDKIQMDLSNRAPWERKLVYATNQRMGIKRMTNTPYPGAPDIPLPETDKMISKKKPEFVLSVVGQKSPCTVQFGSSISNITPELMEKRRKAEAAFNMIISSKLDICRMLTTVVDQFLEKGHGIIEIFEEFSTKIQHHIVDLKDYIKEDLNLFKKLSREEKKVVVADQFKLDIEDEDESNIIDSIISQFAEGNEIIEYDILEVESMPKLSIPQSEDILVPTYSMDIDFSERVTHRIWLTERQLRERAINGIYDRKKVEKLFKEGQKTASTPRGMRDIISNQKNTNEGIQVPNLSETWLIYKVCCWIPRKKDGRYERWVISYLDTVPGDDGIIQAIKFPYEFDGWNYVKHDYEVRDGRYFSSRGIPEKISAANEFMERCFNNMLVRDEINNNPIFSVLNRSRLRSTTNRFIPGQVLRVNSHDEIQEVGTRLNRVDLSSNLMIDKLKAFIEEYLGSTDQLFRNSTNAGGGKTLGEVQLGVQLANSQVSIDILLFNETLRKVYKKIWSILKNRIGKPFFVNGEYVTSDDFDFDADILPTGSAEALNRQYEVAMAQAILDRITQQMAMNSPIVLPENLYEAFMNWLEKSGTRIPDRFITKPQIVSKVRQQQALQQQAALAQIDSQLASRQAELESQGVQTIPIQQEG